MSWLPPFFTCGACGGEIGRRPVSNPNTVQKAIKADLDREIYAWLHRTVPDGVEPHTAVLGTPVPTSKPAVDLDVPVEHPTQLEPEIPARPAMHDELPGSAASLDRQAAAKGWTVEAWLMRGPLMDARWKFSRMRTSIVLRFLRDGHGLVASWAEEANENMAFDFAYSIGHHVEALTSPELRAAVGRPRAICESCGETSALHVSTDTGPVCFTEYQSTP